MLADTTNYGVLSISLLPADAHIRRFMEVKNMTCAYCFFVLVLYYQTAKSFNLYAILCELDTLQHSHANTYAHTNLKMLKLK